MTSLRGADLLVGRVGREAFSNSDLVIWPLPSASICENRSCSAAERLVGAELVVDEPCAASSACIV
ncbi:MAG TPA: hypothetical protein VFG31_07730, partial [Conexibacter sp.]|nr:hypothetical protein [Conexibacter sp.]